uniref:Zinc finger, CCHC-type n=1 Tax=Tanacetum cinerariifolium TaxID=118510 RepID=A0A6L2N7A9_TANCI|nr:zinc finger, CCHC-type [Tanacetum cinerariifolium]
MIAAINSDASLKRSRDEVAVSRRNLERLIKKKQIQSNIRRRTSAQGTLLWRRKRIRGTKERSTQGKVWRECRDDTRTTTMKAETRGLVSVQQEQNLEAETLIVIQERIQDSKEAVEHLFRLVGKKGNSKKKEPWSNEAGRKQKEQSGNNNRTLETIEPKENTEIDNKKDKATTTLLYQALTEDVILQVAGCKTANELWESLKKRHVGEEKVQQAWLQSLMIGFNTLQMKDDDTVDAFMDKLNGYATKAKELGKTLDESLLVRKLLDSTPDKFIQIVSSIEQTSDLVDITLDEITGKFKAFEERIKLQKGGQDESQENLLFAQGEHSGKGKRFNKRGTGGIIKTEITQKRETQTIKETQIGTKEQSNLILEEDDKPLLLMTTHETEHEEVLLNEGQIQLEKYASEDASTWYLDNGASNHMTETKSHFKDRRKRMRTSHLNFDDINKMTRKGLVDGIPRINHVEQICDACLLGKHSRTPFPNQAKFRSKNPLDLVYGDLCGPISPATHSGKKLIFFLVDDCIRFMWAYFLTSKDQALSTFKEFRQQIEIEMRMKLRMLRTDRGGVDNENATLGNTDINGDDDNTYQEPDTIRDLVSPITPPTYTFNPHSNEEVEATIKEPRNYKEASTDKKWIEAMEIELDSINKNNTWILTTLPVNQKLDQTLKSLDFKGCNLEQAVYTKRSKTSTLIVGVYVDDLIITGTPRKEIDVFKSQMKEKFEMSDLGLLAYYLGIEVTQTGGEITIKQTSYITKILKETYMMDSNDAKIPMDPDTMLVKADDENSVDTTYYRSLIGSLRYLLHTRPDLSYSLGLLSRFMQGPKEHPLKAVKQVIRYIKGTKEHGIIYKKEGGCKITGYSDSSYGINTDQGKGTTGIVFYFEESPITWCTQKQPTVALSSCESEFMAATAATCQALWLKRILSELTGCEEKRITLKVDNVSAIALVRNPVFHGRSKHIDIRYHFIRECVENGHINVEHVSGELQRADNLTKALPRLKFLKNVMQKFILELIGKGTVLTEEVLLTFHLEHHDEETNLLKAEYIQHLEKGLLYLESQLQGIKEKQRYSGRELTNVKRQVASLESQVEGLEEKEDHIRNCILKMKNMIREHPWIPSNEHLFGIDGAYDYINEEPSTAWETCQELRIQKTYNGIPVNIQVQEPLEKAENDYKQLKTNMKRIKRDIELLETEIENTEEERNKLMETSFLEFKSAIQSISSAMLPNLEADLTLVGSSIVDHGFQICYTGTNIASEVADLFQGRSSQCKSNTGDPQYASDSPKRCADNAEPWITGNVISCWASSSSEKSSRASGGRKPKQVIRYIKGTKEHGIIYKKEGGCKITGYSDSSYGINTHQGKRTTWIVFYFEESPITWCTQKQPTVALSSCESEFMTATAAACQALWLKRLLSELTGCEEKRITLKVDNVSAIALVRSPVFHGRSKHIDIRYHFIRECVENGHINVEHVRGELQRADILTNALPRLKFVTMRQMLGVQDLGRSNDQD